MTGNPAVDALCTVVLLLALMVSGFVGSLAPDE